MEPVAVFPIPGCVVFPGQVFPLHVFEPRYRKLLQYCTDKRISLAVANVAKRIHKVRGETRLANHQRNLDTYKPMHTVTAGEVTILERFADHRVVVRVDANRRLQLVNCQQMLPFYIYEAIEWNDLEEQMSDDARDARNEVLQFIRSLFVQARVPRVNENLKYFESLGMSQLSFEIFSFVQFDTEFKQWALELQSPSERLVALLSVLRRGLLTH